MKPSHDKHRLHRWWKRLQIKDRFLLIFMILLLMQSALNLFVKDLAISETSPLDIVIRTTSATIFGYFIGIGFLRETGSSHTKTVEESHDSENSQISNPSPPSKESSLRSELENEQATHIQEKRFVQQITIVAVIGIVSLLMLLLASNVGGEATMENTATLSQLRDFVSGSVGFLVGHSKNTRTLIK